jgi:hypothetical protein
MMLDLEEQKYIDLLQVGNSIIKLKGRVHKPMLVRFPLVQLKKNVVTDKMLFIRFKSIQGTPQGCEKYEQFVVTKGVKSHST